jgi:hypothetical protein
MSPAAFAGAVGATAFALSGLPQALRAVHDGHARGVASGTVGLWLIGELAMLAYTLAEYTSDWVLLANYGANAVIVGVIAWYHWFGTARS